jgi:hypothetical protein
MRQDRRYRQSYARMIAHACGHRDRRPESPFILTSVGSANSFRIVNALALRVTGQANGEGRAWV